MSSKFKREAGQTSMKNSKRILSVKIKTEVDDAPDTSFMGEYSNRPTSEFSIDRAHSEDCASVRFDAQAAKVDGRLPERDNVNYAEWESLDEAVDMLINLAEETTECDCNFSGHWSAREYRYFNPSS